ncbi:hypothetical protein Celaphus_00012598, partial [Cervus elaphus hippelaphus]
ISGSSQAGRLGFGGFGARVEGPDGGPPSPAPGRWYSLLRHRHPPPAEPFELPEIRVIKLFPEVRPQMPPCMFRPCQRLCNTCTYRDTRRKLCNSAGAQCEV